MDPLRRWSSGRFGFVCAYLIVVVPNGVVNVTAARHQPLQLIIGVFWLVVAPGMLVRFIRMYRHRNDPPVEQPVVYRPAP